MRILDLFVVISLLSCCALPQRAEAQQSLSLAETPTADSVLRKSIQRYAAAKSFRSPGVYILWDEKQQVRPEIRFEVVFQRPNRFRFVHSQLGDFAQIGTVYSTFIWSAGAGVLSESRQTTDDGRSSAQHRTHRPLTAEDPDEQAYDTLKLLVPEMIGFGFERIGQAQFLPTEDFEGVSFTTSLRVMRSATAKSFGSDEKIF